MDATTFSATLLAAGTAALPYILGGVAAGAVILTATTGIRAGLKALRTVGK